MNLNLFFLFFISFITNIYCHNWIENSNKDTVVSYIFAPGTFSCECRMSIYMPKFISSTCEEIKCGLGIEVLKEPAFACNFSEVELKRFHFSFAKPINSMKILINKIANLISSRYNAKHFITIKPLCGKKEETLSAQLTDISKINFGQDLDILSFKNNYQLQMLNLNNNFQDYKKNIVLYGFSRGAATIFNFVAMHKPKEVKALICEGIFDSIPNILSHNFKYSHHIMLKMLENLTCFKINGIAPIKCVNEIPLDLPILFIASYEDFIVPYQSILNLYKRLWQLGHKKVHIIILKNSGHLNYVFSNNQDKEMYEQSVHAFYKKYSLPYVEELANKGQEFIENSQPNY